MDPQPEAESARILVVDDDRAVTRIIRSMLELEGYGVEELYSGVGLVERIAHDPPGLILLDINMPEVSGVELLEDIRKRCGDGIPVVMLTGETENVELAVDTFKHGASDYLVKPVAMEKLLSSVRTTLKIHRLKRERERINDELRRKNEELAGSKRTIEEFSKRLHQTNTELVDANKQLEAIFNSVSDGMATVDADLRVRQFNRAAARMAGLSREAVLGRPLGEVLRGRMFNAEGLAKLAASSGDEEVEIVGHDGRLRHALASVDHYEGPGGETGMVLVLRDISELRQLQEELRGRYRFGNIVGHSHQMIHVYELVEQIAPTATTVLIVGESGTGKELIAHAIHYNSPRANGPMVKVHCSALAETLLESELFGHVKGAFTGASVDKVGRFEAADGGTIFLDEIADMSPLIQLKLLRVIQEREIERVGESRSRKVDVRIVAATNTDLRVLMRDGKFREDLYYRLKVFPIQLPPLRARRDDIPLLVEHFVQRFAEQMSKPIVGGTEEAMARLLDYGWPGNVRELENAIEHAFVKARGPRFDVADLPPEVRVSEAGSVEEAPWAEWEERSVPRASERDTILSALVETGWNKSRAARRLGIGRTTLWRKIREFDIRPPSH